MVSDLYILGKIKVSVYIMVLGSLQDMFVGHCSSFLSCAFWVIHYCTAVGLILKYSNGKILVLKSLLEV